jgi:LPXTG-site transpeptidase (sortase) family protein
MYKITLKIFLLLFIFFLLGYGVSLGLSYIERNVPLDGYLEYLVNRNKEYVEDNSIMASLKETSLTEETGDKEIEDFGTPVYISIESVGISLDIKVGEYDYDNQTWTLTNGSAYWANLSDSILMENSNTVIYAHNQVNEFYKTKYLKVGDLIKIKTDQGKEVSFKYVSDTLVSPERGDLIVADSSVSQLTLITCNGIFSENRRIIYAEMITKESL